MFALRYSPSPYRYNPACACDFCANGGNNPNPLMVIQGGSYSYAEPHTPPGSRPPWASAAADPLVERPATDVGGESPGCPR